MRQRLESYTKSTASFHQVSCGDMPISVSPCIEQYVHPWESSFELLTLHASQWKTCKFESQGRLENSVGGRRREGGVWDWIWFREENENSYYVIWRCMFVVRDMVLYVLLPIWEVSRRLFCQVGSDYSWDEVVENQPNSFPSLQRVNCKTLPSELLSNSKHTTQHASLIYYRPSFRIRQHTKFYVSR